MGAITGLAANSSPFMANGDLPGVLVSCSWFIFSSHCQSCLSKHFTIAFSKLLTMSMVKFCMTSILLSIISQRNLSLLIVLMLDSWTCFSREHNHVSPYIVLWNLFSSAQWTEAWETVSDVYFVVFCFTFFLILTLSIPIIIIAAFYLFIILTLLQSQTGHLETLLNALHSSLCVYEDGLAHFVLALAQRMYAVWAPLNSVLKPF